MSDNELLLAISNMMDKKLEPIQSKINEMDVRTKQIETNQRNMQDDIIDIKGQIKELDVRIKQVEINQENKILPRLQNIEACYTSTYERYARGVDQIENTMQDMSLIKTVVTEHSAKLEKIS